MPRPILIAEDVEADLELTLIALEKCRVVNEVIAVRDGQEVLEFLCCEGKWKDREQILPAFIILDIKMPRMTGLEVLEKMHAFHELRLIPVIVLSSSKEEKDLLRAYDSGANAYVIKPVEFSDLEEAISEIANMWGLRNVPPPV